MELRLLNHNEIRISLSSEEMESMDINIDDFDYEDTKTRRIIWELFDRAREETGFDAAGDSVVVKVYPKRNGGCELYVSKLTPKKRASDRHSYFLFDSLDDLLEFRAKLTAEELSLWRRCYPVDEGRYCLCARPIPSGRLMELIYEYAAPLEGEYIEDFVKEQARLAFDSRKGSEH